MRRSACRSLGRTHCRTSRAESRMIRNAAERIEKVVIEKYKKGELKEEM